MAPDAVATKDRRCQRCGFELSRTANFCGHCGAPTADHLKQRTLANLDAKKRRSRASLAILVVYVGVIAGVLMGRELAASSAPWMVEILVHVLLVGSGLAGVALLGRGAWAASIGDECGRTQAVIGMLAGILMFGLGVAWVGIIRVLTDGGDPVVETEGGWWMLFQLAVISPFIEEWLCRGVLWESSRRLVSVGSTVVLTALLFSFMHGLGGGALLELPHRFLYGLVLGGLRVRTNSLLPGIIAHGVLNLLVVIVPEI